MVLRLAGSARLLANADPAGTCGTPELGIGRHGRDALACALLVGWVAFLYRDAFAVYFLNEDFTWLRHCSVGPLRALWARVAPDGATQVYSWRPLAQLWFGLNYAAWGMHPAGYRFTVIAWHALAACALFALGTQVADRFRGLIAAVVFAAHPLHVESISWTCACAGLIASTLGLLALWAFVRWRTVGGPAMPVLIAYAAALLVQESALSIPVLCASSDALLLGNRRAWPSRAAMYAALLGVTAGFFLARRMISPAALNYGMVGFDPRWPVSAAALAVFLMAKLQVAGAMLLTLPTPLLWTAVPLTLAVGLASVRLWWRGEPMALWAFVWIGIVMAPFSLLLLGPFPRYMHAAAAGFGLLAAALLGAAFDGMARWDRRLATVGVSVALFVWCTHSVRQIDVQEAQFVRRGELTRQLLTDLLRVLPQPRTGSTLAFYGVGDLRVRDQVFVFGLDEAVRFFYGDNSLKIEFRALPPMADDAYHLWYHDGGLELLARGQP